MNQPTKEQQQWFWEQCGLIFKSEVGYHGWYREIGVSGLESVFIPHIDSLEFLGFLFKYAVPRVVGGDSYTLYITHGAYQTWIRIDAHYAYLESVHTQDKDPALALFWAIHKALG